MRLARLVVLLLMVMHGRATAQTVVSIAFHGAAGEPVPITRAQLLAAGWGEAEQYELPFEGHVVRLDLESTRPDFADGLADTRGFLYVKADGYTSIISQAFVWPSKSTRTAIIDFRNRQRVTVAKGTNATLSVQMRRPIPRRVRLVDGSGHSVAGVKVEASAFWSALNHYGVLNGREQLVSDSTDADGFIDVPDIDGTYAFRLLDRLILFSDRHVAAGSGDRAVVLPLTNAETTMRVRRARAR